MIKYKLQNSSGRKRSYLKEQIISYINEQGLQSGVQLAPQVELARHFSTTLLTMHRALNELVEEGILYTQQGVGTFVAKGATKKRAVSLILPGEGLDQPENNPEYWPYVQTILRCFISAAGTSWIFSPRAVVSRESALRIADDLRDHAAVFFLHRQDEWGLFDLLVGERIAPAVCLGLPHPSRPCLSIDHDRVNGARLGVEHMLKLGYRRIAFVGSPEFWGQMSWEGYRMALQDAGVSAMQKLCVRLGESRADGARSAELLLAKQKGNFDAIFVDSDLRALGVLDALHKAGVQVPEQVGVMGYDGLDFACLQPLCLTSVRIPWAKMILTALAELENSGAASPVKHVSILGDIIAGKTLRQKERA